MDHFTKCGVNYDMENQFQQEKNAYLKKIQS